MKAFLILAMIVQVFVSRAQTNYRIAVRFQNAASTELAKFFTLSVNGSLMTTDGAGVIDITLPGLAGSVSVNSVNEHAYIIKDPASKILVLPKDPANILPVLVAAPDASDLTRIETSRLAKSLNSIEAQLNKANSDNQRNQQHIDRLMRVQDSLLQVAKQFKISDTALRTERELMDGRDKYFQMISKALKDYVSEARDLNDAFKNIAVFAFDNPKAYKLLDSTIKQYNNAFKYLFDNNDDFKESIGMYWKSRELPLNYQNTADFTLNDIHRPYVLPLNTDVIPLLNSYISEHNKKRREEIKKQATATINGIVPVLDSRLTILEIKINDLIHNLQELKDMN